MFMDFTVLKKFPERIWLRTKKLFWVAEIIWLITIKLLLEAMELKTSSLLIVPVLAKKRSLNIPFMVLFTILWTLLFVFLHSIKVL